MHEKILEPRGFARLDLDRPLEPRPEGRTSPAVDDALALELVQRLSRAADPVASLRRLQAQDPSMARAALDAVARHRGRQAAEQLARAVEGDQAPRSRRPQTRVRPVLEDALREPAAALPGRAELERFFGEDLGDVRVHRGARARGAARALGADAFALGNHIVLGDTEPTPELLAEEVAHTRQQRGGRLPALDDIGRFDFDEIGDLDDIDVTARHDAVEREARAAAAAFVARRQAPALSASGLAIMRSETGQTAPELALRLLENMSFPIDLARLDGQVLRFADAPFDIDGLTFERFEALADVASGNLAGTLHATLDLAPHLTAKIELGVTADGQVEASFTTGLTLPGLVDCKLACEIGADGLTGTATASTKDLAPDLHGAALDSGTLDITLAADGTIRAGGKLVLQVAPLGTVELAAKVELPCGTAFDGSQLTGAVTVTQVEPLALADGLSIGAAQLIGFWSGRQFVANGMLDVDVHGRFGASSAEAAAMAGADTKVATAGVFGSYLWSPERTGFTGSGHLEMLEPVAVGTVGNDEVRIERGRFGVSVVDDAVVELSGTAALTGGTQLTGEVTAAYDLTTKTLTGSGQVTVIETIDLPGGLQLLGGTAGGNQITAVVLRNELAQLSGALHARLPVPGTDAAFELQASNALLDLKRDALTGAFTLEVTDHDLRIGPADGVHLLLEPGAAATAVLVENALVSLDSALAFSVHQGETRIARGTIRLTLDDEGPGGSGEFVLEAPLVLPGADGPLQLGGGGQRFTFQAARAWLESLEFPEIEVSLSSLLALLDALSGGASGSGERIGGGEHWQLPSLGLRWPRLPSLGGGGRGVAAADPSGAAGGNPLAGLIEALSGLTGRLGGMWRLPGGAGSGGGGDIGGIDLNGPLEFLRSFRLGLPGLGPVRFGDGSPFQLDLSVVRSAFGKLSGTLPFAFDLAVPGTDLTIPVKGGFDGQLFEAGKDGPWGEATVWLDQDVPIAIGERDRLVLRGGETGARLTLRIDASGPGPVQLDLPVSYDRDGEPLFTGKTRDLKLDLGAGELDGAVQVWNARPLATTLGGDWRLVVAPNAAAVTLTIAHNELDALTDGGLLATALRGDEHLANVVLSGVTLPLGDGAVKRTDQATGDEVEIDGLTGTIAIMMTKPHPLAGTPNTEALAVEIVTGTLTGTLLDGELSALDAALDAQVTRAGQRLGRGEAHGTVRLAKPSASGGGVGNGDPKDTTGASREGLDYHGEVSFTLDAPISLGATPDQTVDDPSGWGATVMAGSRVSIEVGNDPERDEEAAPLGRPHVDLAAVFWRDGQPVAGGVLDGHFGFSPDSPFTGEATVAVVLPTPVTGLDLPPGDTFTLEPTTVFAAQLDAGRLVSARVTGKATLARDGDPMLDLEAQSVGYSKRAGLEGELAMTQRRPVTLFEYDEDGVAWKVVSTSARASVTAARRKLTEAGGNFMISLVRGDENVISGWFEARWALDAQTDRGAVDSTALAVLLSPTTVALPGGLSVELQPWLRGMFEIADSRLVGVHHASGTALLDDGQPLAELDFDDVTWAGEGRGERKLSGTASATLSRDVPLPAIGDLQATLQTDSELSVTLANSAVESVGGTLHVGLADGATAVLTATVEATRAPVTFAATDGQQAQTRPVLEGEVDVVFDEAFEARLTTLASLQGVELWLDGGARGKVAFSDGRIVGLGGGIALSLRRGDERLATITCEDVDVPLGVRAGQQPAEDDGISGRFSVRLDAERLALGSRGQGDTATHFALLRGSEGTFELANGDLTAIEARGMTFEADVPTTTGRVVLHGSLTGRYEIEGGLKGAELVASIAQGFVQVALPAVPFPDAEAPLQLAVRIGKDASLTVTFDEKGKLEDIAPDGPVGLVFGGESTKVVWGRAKRGENKVERDENDGWSLKSLGLSFAWVEALVGHALRLGDWLSAKLTGLLGMLVEGGESAWQWVVGLLQFEGDEGTKEQPEPPQEGQGWRVVLDLLARIKNAVVEGARVALGSLSDAASGALARVSGLLRSVFDALGRFRLGGGTDKPRGPRKGRQPRRTGSLPKIGWPELALDLLGGFVTGELDDSALESLGAGIEAQLLSANTPVATGNLVGHYDVDGGTFDGTLSLTTSDRYVVPLGKGADDAGLLSGLAIVVESGQGLTLSVEKSALSSVSTGLQAALYDGDVAVGTLALQGVYDFGTPEAGYHGAATVAMSEHVPLSQLAIAGELYTLRLSATSGGQLDFAGTALTGASGALALELVRGEDDVAATLDVHGSYADGRFQGELGLAVENPIFLGEHAGLLLSLTGASGATVQLDETGAIAQITGGVEIALIDADSLLWVATVRGSLQPWTPGQGGPSGSLSVEMAPGYDPTPDALRRHGLGLLVHRGQGVATLTDGALTDVHLSAELSLYDTDAAGQVDLTGDVRWTPGADDGLSVAARMSVPSSWRLPEVLGGDLVPDHRLWLAVGSGGSLSWSPGAGVSLGGGVVVELDRIAGAGAQGKWLEVALRGALSTATGGSFGEVSARLLQDMPVGEPVEVGKETWTASLMASGTRVEATVLEGRLVAARGELSVGVDDTLGRLFQATSGVRWDARGDQPALHVEPTTLEVLRDKPLGEVGGYALVLSKETTGRLELDGVVPRVLDGALVVRLDQPLGRKVATVRATQRLVLGEVPVLDGELEVELHRALPAVGERGTGHWIELRPGTQLRARFASGVPEAVTGKVDVRYGEGERDILGGELDGEVGLSGEGAKLEVTGKATLLVDVDVASTTLGDIKLRRGTEASVELGHGGLEALTGTVHLGVFAPGTDTERARISLEDAEYWPGKTPAIGGTGTLTVNTSLPLLDSPTHRLELRQGTSLVVPMENGVPSSVSGTLAFVYSDVAGQGEGLTPLVRGDVEGSVSLNGDGAVSVDGTMVLARALEMQAGASTTLVVQAGTRGQGSLRPEGLQSLEGTMLAEIARQQPGREPVVVSVEANGRYEHPKRELVHAEGSATMTRGELVFFDDHLHVTELGGAFVWSGGRLERLGGHASFGVAIANTAARPKTRDGREAAGQAFTSMTGAGRILWRHGDDGRDAVSGDGELQIERPGVLTAGLTARFQEDGGFDLTGHGHYWLNEMFSGDIGVRVDEQWDPVIDGELKMEDLELIGEHELFKIYRPQLFVLSANAAIGPVPVTGSLGIGAGARLVTKPLLASGAIGIDDFRPMAAVAPAIEAELGLSTGIALETDLVVWADGGIGVSGASVKLRLTGGLSVTVDADLGLGMSVVTDPSTGAVGGSVSVEAGLGVDAAARLVPSVVLELGKAFEHELTRFELDLGQLFSVDWQGVYPWGDVDGSAPAPQPTAVASTKRQGLAAVQGDGEKQELSELSDYKAAPVDGTREGGPQLGKADDADAPAPPLGDDGFDTASLGESFGEYAAWIELAKDVVDLVGTFMDIWNAGGTFDPFTTFLPPQLKSVLAVGYFAWEIATGELSLSDDIVTPMGEVWAGIEQLGVFEKLAELFIDGVVALVEWFKGVDVAGLVGDLIGWIRDWAMDLAGDNEHFREAVRLIFEQIARAQDTLEHVLSLVESGELTWDLVEDLADEVVDNAEVLAEIGYHVAMGTGQAIGEGVEWVGGKLEDAGAAIGGAAEGAFNAVAGREKLLSPELLAKLEAQQGAAQDTTK